MKLYKRIIIFLTAAVTLLLTACGSPPTLNATYEGEIQATDGRMNYTAYLVSDGDKVRVSLTSPESVAGLSYAFTDGELHTTLNGLDCIPPADSLPSIAFPELLYTTFTALDKAEHQTSEDGVDTFRLGTATVTAKNGKPLSLTAEHGNWTITFE